MRRWDSGATLRARFPTVGATRITARLLGCVIAVVTLALTAFPSVASATPDPTNVSSTLEGCNNAGPGLPYASAGPFVCADAAYGTGNLGKGWNELDLVPFRLVLHATNAAPATQTYAIGIAADNCQDNTGEPFTCADTNAGDPGFDTMSVPVLNTGLSDPSCQGLSTPGQQTVAVKGGDTIGEVLTIIQHQDTTCVYDYYARLALGSHLYPGSSLHAYLMSQDFSKQQQDVPLPVNQIAPQSVNKDMTASQGSDHTWTLTKSATPATLDFPNTCAVSNPTSLPVHISLTWTRNPANPYGPITVITHVYGTNPASRPITTNVTDQITGDPNPMVAPDSASVVVPANTANQLLLTDSVQVPSGTTSLSDLATATYTDTITNVPIPGSTQATASASVANTGPELDQSATITGAETISGSNYSFSVPAPSVGGFTGGYVAGTQTSNEVDWSSGSVSGNGSVTFDKTVYVTAPSSGSGELDENATLLGSDSATTGTSASASASVGLSAEQFVSVEIDKTIQNVLQAGDPDQTFTFDVYNSSNVKVATRTLTFTAGGSLSKSASVSDLPPDTYTVHEEGLAGWQPQTDVQVPLTAACSGTATFHNVAAPAFADAVKVTDPAGHESGWTMTLNGPGTGAGGESEATDATGTANFTTPLQEGAYTITETPKTGWAQTSSSGCSFTVNYPADGGQAFTCTIHNQEQAKIIVKKVTVPSGATQEFTFTPTGYNGGNTFQLSDGQTNDSGYVTPGSGYAVSEAATAGWDQTGASCDGTANTPSSITLSPGDVVTCTFTNTERGHIVIKKVTVDTTNSTQQFTFTPTGYNGGNTFQLSNGQTNDSGAIKPGSGYAVSEGTTSGWKLTSSSCDNGNDPSTITVTPGQTVTCTFTNTHLGQIVVKKVTNPSGASQQFTFTPTGFNGGSTFQLSGGQSFTSVLLAPGSGYAVSEGSAAGWDQTSASCDGTGNTPSSITVPAGGTVTCTFTNTERGQVKVVKTVSGAAPTGTQAFTFQLRSGASALAAGAVLETGTANAADGGVILFNTSLVPGQTYQMCEQMTVGWMTTLGPPLYSVYNPSGDNSVVCTDFTVSAGQTLTFSINNTPPPGGLALTIGFWKNWSSCSGGKQAPTLDQTLLKLANAGKPETLGGLVINPLTLGAKTACQYAVDILNKATTGGSKMPSDPLFNMASQLLGADLNVGAGAGACAAAASAISQAHALLTKYGFNGVKSSSQLHVTSADLTLANNLANTLNAYNNNQLCSLGPAVDRGSGVRQAVHRARHHVHRARHHAHKLRHKARRVRPSSK